MTYDDLGRRVGLSRSYLADLEHGRRRHVGHATSRRLAEALGRPVEDFDRAAFQSGRRVDLPAREAPMSEDVAGFALKLLDTWPTLTDEQARAARAALEKET